MASLHPPDPEPPRFAPLSPDQRALVTEFLTVLAFDEGSGWQEEALELLVDYWGHPGGERDQPSVGSVGAPPRSPRR
jgi:hypothetical protein